MRSPVTWLTAITPLDSFLFDFNTKDGLEFLNMVKETIESGGKYPVKVSKGVNYHEMQDITEKFKWAKS